MKISLLAAAAALSIPLSSSLASEILFDFEHLPASGFSGGYTSYQDSSGGVGINLRRTSGAAFDIQDLSMSIRPAGWGDRVLSPFSADRIDAFVVDFTGATPVTGVSIEFGDYGGDDGLATFTVWSGAAGTGEVLASQTQYWGGELDEGHAPGRFEYAGSRVIGSVVFGGERARNSLYWDNLGVMQGGTFVPTPSAAVLSLAGVGGLAARRRRTV